MKDSENLHKKEMKLLKLKLSMILKLKEKLIKLPHPDFFFLKVKDIFSPVKKHTIEITKKTTQSEPF